MPTRHRTSIEDLALAEKLAHGFLALEAIREIIEAIPIYAASKDAYSQLRAYRVGGLVATTHHAHDILYELVLKMDLSPMHGDDDASKYLGVAGIGHTARTIIEAHAEPDTHAPEDRPESWGEN